MQRCNQPIPCSTFNHDGTIFAYGVCIPACILNMIVLLHKCLDFSSFLLGIAFSPGYSNVCTCRYFLVSLLTR